MFIHKVQKHKNQVSVLSRFGIPPIREEISGWGLSTVTAHTPNATSTLRIAPTIHPAYMEYISPTTLILDPSFVPDGITPTAAAWSTPKPHLDEPFGQY